MADGGFARWLAAYAGQALIEVRGELGFDDPDVLMAAGRKVSHDILVTELAHWRPADRLLTADPADEAGHAGDARADTDRVWLVDPLGGAEDFASETGRDWAVHVALWAAYGGLRCGAVALPARHRVLGTDHPPAYPPLSLSVATGGAVRIAMEPEAAERCARLGGFLERAKAQLVPIACPGGQISAVIDGEVDGCVLLSSSHVVQTAALVAVATATGLYASGVDGSALEYNRADHRLTDLLVCRKDLAPRLLAALRVVGSGLARQPWCRGA